MQSHQTQSFSGMTLTEIFQIQSLQSLFIKFWYLGLTSDSIVASEDAVLFKAIRKAVSFANCFSYQLPLRTYINFVSAIMQALSTIQPRKTFEILLGHLRNNKVVSVSFELFGVAFLQLFGRVLELLNAPMMSKILRKIFLEITTLNKVGISSIKLKGIKPISFQDLIPNFRQLLQEREKSNSKPLNPQTITKQVQKAPMPQSDLKTLKGRLQSQHLYNTELRQSISDQYPIGEKMRVKDKAHISCFMMGGFEIVDYSQSINQLHKKLLTKILLNK